MIFFAFLFNFLSISLRHTGFQFARRLVNTKVMGDWEFQLTNRLLPECAKHGNYTPAYMECHLRQITIPGGAPVGTCRMGAANDPNAVVDPNLRYVSGHSTLILYIYLVADFYLL